MTEKMEVPGPSQRNQRRPIQWVGFVAVALASIFALPKFVSVAPSISDSYLFGYSNRTGVLLLIAFLLVGGIFSKNLDLNFELPSEGSKISTRLIALWMGIFAVAWALMYFLVHGLQGFAESLYMIDRLKMLVAGGRPYRDFEFAYGALLLYGPRALMVLHLSAEQAYFAFLLVSQVGGVWMLARVFNMLDYPGAYAASIFSMLCFFALPTTLSTGLNYALVRFVAAPYFGLLVQRTDARGGPRDRALAMAMAAAFTLMLLLISPEMGVAFGAGTAGYFTVFGRWDRVSAAAYLAFLFAEVAIMLAANGLDVFATLKAFSGGAFSFPIVPAGHILLFFFGCGLVTLFVAARLRQGSCGDGLLMLVAISAATLFAALGRCDPGHTMLSALGLVIVGTVLASTMPQIWRWYRIAFLIFVVLLPTASGVWNARAGLSKLMFLRLFQGEPQGTMTHLDTVIEHGMQRQLGEEKGRIKFEKLKNSSSAGAAFDLQTAYPELAGVLQAPFGYSPQGFGVYHSPRIASGYFDALNNAFTPPMVERKIDELRAHPERQMLLPENFNEQCKVDPVAEKRLIRTLFAYPFHGTVRNPGSVWEPLCGYINQHYRKTIDLGPAGYGYSVWAE